MALAAPRTNLENLGPTERSIGYKAKASQTFYNGALVAVGTDGYLVPAASTAGLRVVGVADLGNKPSVVSAAADGTTIIEVKSGIMNFASGSSGDALTIADLEREVFVIDDQTVGRLSTAGRPVAGRLKKVDGAKMFVAVGVGVATEGPSNSEGGDSGWLGLGSVDALGAPGAISVTAHITELTVDGTDAHTLADGLFIGQEKIITVVAGTNTPVSTVTPATPNGFATATALGVLGDFVRLIWTADGWSLAGHGGVTIT